MCSCKEDDFPACSWAMAELCTNETAQDVLWRRSGDLALMEPHWSGAIPRNPCGLGAEVISKDSPALSDLEIAHHVSVRCCKMQHLDQSWPTAPLQAWSVWSVWSVWSWRSWGPPVVNSFFGDGLVHYRQLQAVEAWWYQRFWLLGHIRTTDADTESWRQSLLLPFWFCFGSTWDPWAGVNKRRMRCLCELLWRAWRNFSPSSRHTVDICGHLWTSVTLAPWHRHPPQMIPVVHWSVVM